MPAGRASALPCTVTLGTIALLSDRVSATAPGRAGAALLCFVRQQPSNARFKSASKKLTEAQQPGNRTRSRPETRHERPTAFAIRCPQPSRPPNVAWAAAWCLSSAPSEAALHQAATCLDEAAATATAAGETSRMNPMGPAAPSRRDAAASQQDGSQENFTQACGLLSARC
ncbi:hypothetical protein BDZ88DRAFT_415810 [Geranomyces variabilis]|nr:hypothetical protein BDZ88DRAFT_415810 [Geranomyces variabilis]